MAELSELIVWLSGQPLLDTPDQPVYVPPRDIRVRLTGLSVSQVFELENVLDQYAWVGLFPDDNKQRLPPGKGGSLLWSNIKGAEDAGRVGELKIHYCGRPFPWYKMVHDADLYVVGTEEKGKEDFQATIMLSLPMGKACEAVRDILTKVNPEWSEAARQSYGALPEKCKRLLPQEYRPPAQTPLRRYNKSF